MLVLFAAYTGLRAGEIGAMRVGRLDLLHRSVHVRESLADVKGKLVFGPTKTYANRTVRLPGFLAEELGTQLAGRSQRAGRSCVRGSLGRAGTPQPLLRSTFQASGGSGWASGWAAVPRPPLHVRCAARCPRGAPGLDESLTDGLEATGAGRPADGDDHARPTYQASLAARPTSSVAPIHCAEVMGAGGLVAIEAHVRHEDPSNDATVVIRAGRLSVEKLVEHARR